MGYYEKVQERPGHKHSRSSNESKVSRGNVIVSAADLAKLREAPKLTFRVVSGNRFRCNQVDIGLLNAAQKEALRNKVRPVTRGKSVEPTGPERKLEVKYTPWRPPALRQVVLGRHSIRVTCPYCNTSKEALLGGTKRCGACGELFQVVYE
jgi:hypothetical protein